MTWASGHDDEVTVIYGTGTTWGSPQVKLQRNRKVIPTEFHVYPDGSPLIPFSHMVPQAAIPPEDVGGNPASPSAPLQMRRHAFC
jgi:hypothetical protein